MARRFGSATAFKASLETHLEEACLRAKGPLEHPPTRGLGGSTRGRRTWWIWSSSSSRRRPEVGDIRSALLATFSARGTHRLPASLDPPPRAWALDFPVMATEAGLSTTDCVKAFSVLEAFWTSNALGSRFTA